MKIPLHYILDLQPIKIPNKIPLPFQIFRSQSNLFYYVVLCN